MYFGSKFCSSFGQGLPSNAGDLENFFAMSISISGMVLFLFLFANVQVGIF